MEDDDEFGDLYSDVLPPVRSSPLPDSRPIGTLRVPSDDDDSKLDELDELDDKNMKLDMSKGVIETQNVLPLVDTGVRVLDETLISKDEILDENFGIEDDGEVGFMFPGLSESGARVSELGGGDEWDDDDSDSEDDLQIVLNDDNGVGMMGMEGGGGLNEDGDDDLVIVTGDVDPNYQPNYQPMDEIKDWGEDGNQAGGEVGDGKDDAGVQKMGFGVGGLGYHSFHSQFKYVRPGAAPIPGAGGAPGQVHPPGGALPFPGRGRGEWRPAGINKNVPPNMQKSFHSGYGLQGWGNSGAGRGFGSGLDFTLPSHKTVFEVDIDGFEEKPWRLQGIDVSDFFNFGMNEESWKEYCKQLEQHRLEATMQSKIRVYESGRTEQEYDPDLPPELAAAAGHDIPSENHSIVKIDVQSDLAMGPARARMQLPTGRAIQVETSYSERLPSIDTRPPRMRDSDTVIEIVLQRSPSPEPESVQQDDVSERLEDFSSKDNKKDEIGSEGDRFDKPQSYNNSRKREVTCERVPHFSETEVEDHVDSESVDHKHSRSSSRLTLGSAEDGSFDKTEAIKEGMDGNTNDSNTLKYERSSHKMKKQKLTTRAEHSSVERGDDREDSIHSVSVRKPVNETRAREDQYSHRKWESNKGYRSYPKPDNYDRKRSKESEPESRSRKPLENGGWKGDHDRDMIPVFKNQTRHHSIPEGLQSKREEPYRESSSRRKRERDSDDNMQREKVERPREREKDKSWVGHTRLKEVSRTSSKDYSFKERGRESVSRREKFENETGSRHRGREDAYLHGYSGSKDVHGVQDKKHKDTLKRGKELDSAIHNSLSTSRRNREDYSRQRIERASSRSYTEQRANDQNPTRKSSKKHKEKKNCFVRG